MSADLETVLGTIVRSIKDPLRRAKAREAAEALYKLVGLDHGTLQPVAYIKQVDCRNRVMRVDGDGKLAPVESAYERTGVL